MVLRCLVGSALDDRLLPPGFKPRLGYVTRLFHISLRLITFAGRLAHLAYHVNESGRITSIVIYVGQSVWYKSHEIINLKMLQFSWFSYQILVGLQIYYFAFYFLSSISQVYTVDSSLSLRTPAKECTIYYTLLRHPAFVLPWNVMTGHHIPLSDLGVHVLHYDMIKLTWDWAVATKVHEPDVCHYYHE